MPHAKHRFNQKRRTIIKHNNFLPHKKMGEEI